VGAGLLGGIEWQCDGRGMKKNIEEQKPDEPDDDFRVLQSPPWVDQIRL
jgi:hypothetical protein